MGQAITVTTKRGTRPDVLRFELNRSLTGMGTERYEAGTEIAGTRPPDELARRLLRDGAAAVTVYSNVVTVTVAAERLRDLEPRLAETIATLFIHYGDDQAAAPAATTALTER